MHPLLARCPVCTGPLHATELACDACGTRIQSAFEPCGFCGLAPEHMRFLELFLRSRGNITSVGNQLDISYPTATKRLDALLSALGLLDEGAPAPAPATAPPPPEPKPNRDADRRQILEQLDRGEITAEDATRLLREL